MNSSILSSARAQYKNKNKMRSLNSPTGIKLAKSFNMGVATQSPDAGRMNTTTMSSAGAKVIFNHTSVGLSPNRSVKKVSAVHPTN